MSREKILNWLNQPSKITKWLLFLVVSLILVWFIYIRTPIEHDWADVYRPAALELAAGRSPYSVTLFAHPTWLLFPLIPLAFLPTKLGSAVLSIVAIYMYYFVARRLGASPIIAIILTAMPQVSVLGIQDPNLDWLVGLGLLLPPQIGLFFVLVKPQLGAGIALFWFVQCWRKGGLSEATKTFAPVLAAFIVSFLLFGFYFIKVLDVHLGGVTWNTSLWPASIPIGLALLASAFHRNRIGFSLLATPFLSPYVVIPSWAVAILGLLPEDDVESVLAAIGIGFLLLLRFFVN